MLRTLGHGLNIRIAGVSDTGKYRQHNEDAFLCLPEFGAAVVADGMGGLARGEVASRIVIDAVQHTLDAAGGLQQGILLAHQRIREASMASAQERMGSTVVGASILRDEATICWVGDSRAYLYRGHKLTLLTRDHSFVNDLIEVGAISAADAESHPNRHVLTRAVGIREAADLKVDSVTQKLQPGDRLLLCSDGLYGFLPESRLIQCLDASEDAAALAHDLVQATLQHSDAEDNITAVCIVVEK